MERIKSPHSAIVRLGNAESKQSAGFANAVKQPSKSPKNLLSNLTLQSQNFLDSADFIFAQDSRKKVF